MKLSPEETALVLQYREDKRIAEYRAAQKIIQANCDHEWVHDYSSNYVSYYKCPKCNDGKSFQFKS